VQVQSGATLNLGTGTNTVTNLGTITGTSGTINLAGDWTNAGGTIDITTSTLNLGGTFTTADLGTITRTGGVINITGTMTNTAATLTVDAARGVMTLQGGTILNGTIAPAALTFSSSGGILDGATIAGDLNLDTASALVRLRNGATFTGSATLSSSNNILAYEYSATETGKTFNLTGTGANLTIEGANTFTLGAGSTLAGRGTVGNQVITGGANAFINEGTINANISGGILTFTSVKAFTNQAGGQVQVQSGATL